MSAPWLPKSVGTAEAGAAGAAEAAGAGESAPAPFEELLGSAACRLSATKSGPGAVFRRFICGSAAIALEFARTRMLAWARFRGASPAWRRQAAWGHSYTGCLPKHLWQQCTLPHLSVHVLPALL